MFQATCAYPLRIYGIIGFRLQQMKDSADRIQK